MKKLKEKKILMLSMAMAALMLSSLTMNAQYREDKFGIQPWFGTSLMGKERGTMGVDLNGQGFGETNGDITGQTFGSPLGSGLFVMLVASAGYASIKSRKKQNKQNRKEN